MKFDLFVRISTESYIINCIWRNRDTNMLFHIILIKIVTILTVYQLQICGNFLIFVSIYIMNVFLKKYLNKSINRHLFSIAPVNTKNNNRTNNDGHVLNRKKYKIKWYDITKRICCWCKNNQLTIFFVIWYYIKLTNICGQQYLQ